jgi:hypothetical protein
MTSPGCGGLCIRDIGPHHLRPVREGRLNFVQGQIVIVAALQIAAVVKLFVH